MKVKLNNPQSYYANNGGIKFGFKGDIVDIDPTFYKLIANNCEIVKDKAEKTKEAQNKSNEQGNQVSIDKEKEDKATREEFRKKLEEKGLVFEDAEFEKMTIEDFEALLEAE